MTDSSKNITQFCSLLSSNNFDESKELFSSFDPTLQKMFLHWAWEIISHKSKYPRDTYLTSFKIFKLFNGSKTSPNSIYNQYSNKSLFKTNYSNASLTFKNSTKSKPSRKSSSSTKSTPSRKTTRSRKTSSSRKSTPSKKYEKEYQKYEEPENDIDPLYIYYTTLRKQNPESKLAIKWLTEHGVYEDDERNELVEEYKNLI